MRRAVGVAVCAIALAGCGDSTVAEIDPTTTVAHPTDDTMRSVVRSWSTRLNTGDLDGVARLFGLPAVAIQGRYTYLFKTRKQISEWHSGLPCSGHLLSITTQRSYATAVFRLGHGSNSRCDAPGTLAAARFEIVDGMIRSWEQVAVPSGNDSPA